MTSQIVSTYTLAYVSARASLLARMEDVPLDYSLLTLNGIGLTSDQTTGSSTEIVRTITLFTVPATPAALTPNLFPGDPTGSPIDSVTVNTKGGSFSVPPVLTVANPTGSPNPVHQASLIAQLGITAVAVSDGGSGYSSNTIAVASGGGLVAGGTQATFNVQVLDGGINAILVLTPGGPYYDLNSLVITLEDTGGGTGAVYTPTLGIESVLVAKPGAGYVPGCTITVTPYFKALFPDAAGAVEQASAVNGWMLQALQDATTSSITQTTVAS